MKGFVAPLLIASAVALGGCAATGVSDKGNPPASPVEQPPDTPAPPPATGMPKGTDFAISLSRLSNVSDEWQTDGASGEFSDMYTKLIVASAFPDAAKPFGYTGRDLMERYVFGKNYTTNLSAKVVVGNLETTVPLVTVSHQSDKSGEHWSRTIHYTASNTPLFLVKANGIGSTPAFTLTVSGTDSYAAHGAATGLEAALSIARASGPTSAVITTLSEQATKDRARALDDAISKLFSTGIQEEHWVDRDLRQWRSDNGKPKGLQLTFRMPAKEGDWNSDLNLVGMWTFTFDFPRPSVFVDWRVCPFVGATPYPRCLKTSDDAKKAVMRDVDPSAVLAYQLVGGSNSLGTIRSFLAQQEWYGSTMTAIANAATAPHGARDLCRRVRDDIVNIGLNGFDADIVLWAVWKNVPLPDRVPDLNTIPSCKSSIEKVESARRTS